VRTSNVTTVKRKTKNAKQSYKQTKMAIFLGTQKYEKLNRPKFHNYTTLYTKLFLSARVSSEIAR